MKKFLQFLAVSCIYLTFQMHAAECLQKEEVAPSHEFINLLRLLLLELRLLITFLAMKKEEKDHIFRYFRSLSENSCGIVKLAQTSPDRKTVLTLIHDPKIAQLLDIKTGHQRHSLTHSGPIYSADFSPDGDTILTRSYYTVRIGDLKTDKQIHTLRHTEQTRSADFSPDSTVIITRSNTSAYLWDVATGNQIHAVKADNSIESATVFWDLYAWNAEPAIIFMKYHPTFVKYYPILQKEVIVKSEHQVNCMSQAIEPERFYNLDKDKGER